MDNDVTRSPDFYDFAAWLQINRKRVISVSVIVLVIAAAVGGYLWHANYNETQSEGALSNIPPSTPGQAAVAGDARPYTKVADDFPGTRAAGRGLLIAGGILFDAGKLEEAKGSFERFMKDYSEDALAPQALIGIAACLEAEGKVADAAAHYEEFIKTHPVDSTTAQAKSALARLDVAQNKPEQAMHLYEDLARSGNNDSWSSEAPIQLQELLVAHPELRKAPVATSNSLSLAPLTNASVLK